MLLFTAFIIFVVVLYNRKQVLAAKEAQLKEAEFENEILQKELERQRAIQDERHRISLDMHDELGAGISAIKLQTEFLKNKINDPLYFDDINDILKASTELNLTMREMMWSLHAGNNDVGHFIQFSKRYAEGFFQKARIGISFEEHNIEPQALLADEVRRNLFLCFKEALNNIYKHSCASVVNIIYTSEQNAFKLIIEDNGKGIADNVHKGNGFHNMERRMQAVKGGWKLTTGEGGTALSFSVGLL